MVDGTDHDVPSAPMEATPALDPRAAVPGTPPSGERALPVAPEAGRPAPAAPATPASAGAATTDLSEREPDAAQMSLARRLRQPRTIISIAVPLAIIAIFVGINGGQLSKVPQLVLAANPALVLLAFVVFYAGFPLRGRRWSILLRGTGTRIGTKDSTEIIFLSWLVNCVVPAKLGDVYRAYLLKINSTASLSRTFGTVFIERVLDLFAIAMLGIAAGYWSFRSGLPPAIQLVFGIGVVVVVVLAVALLTMRNFGRQIIVALPLPHQILDLYDRFEEGVFGALVVRQLPGLGFLTGIIWMTESARLYLVVQALGFSDVSLGLSGAVFVALIGSLLTAVPLSPAGLGIVEAGVVGVLHVAYQVPLPEATAIALLDRVISVFSIIVFGTIAYALSSKPRGLGHIGEPADATSTASTPA
ncbi:MAG: lysylphosphatidylglycerol synthase transmembrane domain-containing protein [Candidatus Limnocylindrales bacterium]